MVPTYLLGLLGFPEFEQSGGRVKPPVAAEGAAGG